MFSLKYRVHDCKIYTSQIIYKTPLENVFMDMFPQVSSTKNYQIIISRIKELVIGGSLKIGDRLPSERELSESFHVSRVCVREALKGLEIMGVVESRQGGGNFIVNNLAATLSDNLSMVYQLSNGQSSDVMQLRKSIEREAARLIMASGSDDAISKIGSVIEEMESVGSYDDFPPLDFKFHHAIIEQSGNPIFAALFQASMSMYCSHIKAVNEKTSAAWEIGQIIQLHRDIFLAIKAGDLAEFDKVIEYHYAEED